MLRNKTAYRKKIFLYMVGVYVLLLALSVRLSYLMIACSDYYMTEAQELHERERKIKAARGEIIDRNGKVLATNQTVCTISVIHSQIKEPEKVIETLSEILDIPEETVRKRVEKVSSIERVKTNVDKEIGDRIRLCDLSGVKVDEDFKRYYPHDDVASKVLGFTGGDNQGIIGLEVIYEEYLKGENGRILTLTDARGVELPEAGESRLEPKDGNNLQISMDINIQKYTQQIAEKAMQMKQADSVEVIVMNPQNGEVLAMVHVPEFNLNEPYQLNNNIDTSMLNEEEKQDLLNAMWRNGCINDTYEPGSTFKIITAAAAFEENVVTIDDHFSCPGFVVVEDRRIRCHKIAGHGSETFLQGTMNSCNPVFVTIGLRVGAERFYDYFKQFGLLKKTGIDLPGEAATIMHQVDNIGLVELATVSFGQSFQVTPIQLAATAGSLVNGGNRITPHFAMQTVDKKGETVHQFAYPIGEQIVSTDTSEKLQYILEKVVSEGTGKNAAIEGFTIGGKTATSQTLPRSNGKYISSFLGFAPAEDPQVLALLIINNPQGIYYGGTIAAPLVRELFENILLYLEIEKKIVEEVQTS